VLTALVMALSYAYILTVAIPGAPGVSWIGHLGGLIGGLASGWIFRTRRTVPGTAEAKIPVDSGGRPQNGTVAVPTTPDNPRAGLYQELRDLGL